MLIGLSSLGVPLLPHAGDQKPSMESTFISPWQDTGTIVVGRNSLPYGLKFAGVFLSSLEKEIRKPSMEE